MISHVFVGVTDFDRALHFYGRLFSTLGIEQRFCDASVPWAGWHSTGATRPFFVISKSFDGEPHDAGNGQMSAFLAASRDQVRHAYSVALDSGGTCEGEPDLRPQYHPHYFGAYFRDPDGNKLCVACHHPE
jgi:catechol 2,3-dioxygenase-like lactoylglutathione lyase family enzyme